MIAVVVLATADRRTGERVAGPERTGPFRGGELPGGIAERRAPDFRLTDARGGSISTKELSGRPYLVTFLYTQCPDVCPLIGEELRQTLELLGNDARRVTVVAVSVDPKGDTPAAVRRWLRRHREPPNFRYATGSRAELRPVWDAYYAAPQHPAREESAHTANVWLIDARGRWRTKHSAGVPFEPRDVAHDLRLLLAET